MRVLALTASGRRWCALTSSVGEVVRFGWENEAFVFERHLHLPGADGAAEATSAEFHSTPRGLEAYWGTPHGLFEAVRDMRTEQFGPVAPVVNVHGAVDAILPGSSGGVCVEAHTSHHSHRISKVEEGRANPLPVITPEPSAGLGDGHRRLTMAEGAPELCVCARGFCVRNGEQFHIVNTWRTFVNETRVGVIHDAVSLPGQQEWHEILLATDIGVLRANLAQDTWTLDNDAPANVMRLWVAPPGAACSVIAACRIGMPGNFTTEIWGFDPHPTQRGHHGTERWRRIADLPFEVRAIAAGPGDSLSLDPAKPSPPPLKRIFVAGVWPTKCAELPIAIVSTAERSVVHN